MNYLSSEHKSLKKLYIEFCLTLSLIFFNKTNQKIKILDGRDTGASQRVDPSQPVRVPGQLLFFSPWPSRLTPNRATEFVVHIRTGNREESIALV